MNDTLFLTRPTMKAKALILGLCTIMTLATLSEHASSQAAPGLFSDANHPSGSPDPEKLDAIWQVDPITDQVSINVSFSTTPQGGRGPKAAFSLLYNSGSTVTLQSNGTYVAGAGGQGNSYAWSAFPLATPVIAPSGPWTTTGPYIYKSDTQIPDQTVTYTYNGTTDTVTYAGCEITGPYVYVDEKGSSHDLNLLNFKWNSYTNGSPPTTYAPACGGAFNSYYNSGNRTTPYWPTFTTYDGSTLATSSESITGPEGISFASGVLTDANGNTLSLSFSNGMDTATDALGRAVYTTDVPIGNSGQIPARSYMLSTYGATGSTETYNIVFSNETLGTFPIYPGSNKAMPHPDISNNEVSSPAFCLSTSCSGDYSVSQPGPGPNGKFTGVTSIEFPDEQSAYTFSYDPIYGTISKITFPTGGYVRFVWAVRDKDWTPYGQFSAVSTIVVTDAYVCQTSSASGCATSEYHWGYTPQNSGTPASLSTSSTPIGYVYAPDGSYTYYTGNCGFQYDVVPYFNIGPKHSCKEVSHANYSSTGVLLASQAEKFTSQGLTQQMASTLYGTSSPWQKQTVYSYDAYNNVTETDESDYFNCSLSGSTCPLPSQSTGPWLRKTFAIYSGDVASAPSTCNAAVLASKHIVNMPCQVTVTDGSLSPFSLVSYSYDNSGNLTMGSKCLAISGTGSGATCPSTSSAWQTQYTSDSHGQITKKVEAYGASGTNVPSTTTYTWTGPDGTTDAYNGYLTTVTYPNNAVDTYTYSSHTGQVENHVDWNKHTTAYSYSDSLNRLTSVVAPQTTDGTTGTVGRGTTSYTYADIPGAFSVEEQHTINTQGTATQATVYFDGLGRKITRQTVSPSCATPIEVDTTYDSMSRVYTVSNPYCTISDATYGVTTFTYDGIGRRIQVETPDNAVSSITYAGRATELSDPSNGTATPQHIQQVNGLGQLISVCEVSSSTYGGTSPASCGMDIGGSGFLTSYSYDPLSNLLAVKQHGQQRTFNYDSLSRLVCASNPESATAACPATASSSWVTGTQGFTYSTIAAPCAPDPAVPCSRTDARGAKTSYTYDYMSRLLSKTYTNGGSTPTACYQYDSGTGTNPSGHLTSEWTQPASSGSCTSPTSFITLKSPFNYDAAGRLLSVQQQTCAGGKCSGPSPYQVSMSYDLAGNATTLTNSVGANNQPLALTNYFDEASRPCLTTSNWTFVASPNIFQISPGTSSPGYSPADGMQNFYLGSTSSTPAGGCGSTPASPINEVLGYTKRLGVKSISVSGQTP